MGDTQDFDTVVRRLYDYGTVGWWQRRGLCVCKPVGCEQPVEKEKMNKSELKEYEISGLCKGCQGKSFDKGKVGGRGGVHKTKVDRGER